MVPMGGSRPKVGVQGARQAGRAQAWGMTRCLGGERGHVPGIGERSRQKARLGVELRVEAEIQRALSGAGTCRGPGRSHAGIRGPG